MMKVLLFSVAYLAATAPETNSKYLNDSTQATEDNSQDLQQFQDEIEISDPNSDEVQNDLDYDDHEELPHSYDDFELSPTNHKNDFYDNFNYHSAANDTINALNLIMAELYQSVQLIF